MEVFARLDKTFEDLTNDFWPCLTVGLWMMLIGGLVGVLAF